MSSSSSSHPAVPEKHFGTFEIMATGSTVMHVEKTHCTDACFAPIFWSVKTVRELDTEAAEGDPEDSCDVDVIITSAPGWKVQGKARITVEDGKRSHYVDAELNMDGHLEHQRQTFRIHAVKVRMNEVMKITITHLEYPKLTYYA